MLTFILHPQNRIIRASSFEEFVEKYRAHSWKPENTTKEFMASCAKRALRVKIDLDSTTPETFVVSLMKARMVSLAKKDLQ